MDNVVLELDRLRFIVVDPQNHAVSAHQHPDAAEGFIIASPRNDLRWVELKNGLLENPQPSS